MRLIRTKIMHQGTFDSLVEAALGTERCLRHRGRYFERVAGMSSAAIYRRSSHGLAWIQERVEEYEFGFFQTLLRGACDRDGTLRPRANVVRGSNGAYRPR